MKSSPIPTSRPADRLPRDRRIDLCYVIGILLVVAGHSGVDPRFASTALFRWIYAFHMPLFFALSGYLFRYGGGSGQVGAGTFARRRALRLLLPLVVWTTLVFIPKGLLSAYAMRPSELSFSAYLHALWPRLARPSSLVFWGAASLVTLRFPSHVAAPFYAAAGILFVASCAALAVDRRLRLPLADDLRRYTFTVYLLHVLPVGLLRGLLYPRLAVDPALFSALLFLSGVLIPWAVGRMARRWIPSSTAGGRLSLRLLGL